MYDHELFLATLSGFTRTLLQPYHADAVLQDLTERVTDVLGLTGSGVSLVKDGRLTYATALPQRLSTLERAQEDAQAGPCVQACHTRQIVAVPDLRRHATNWSAYCTAAARAGVVAAAGIPMYLAETMVGALNLYADRPHQWPEDDLAAAQVLADMATGYLINASQLDQDKQLNVQLQQALDSRVVIEQAEGLVAATRGIDVDQAFELVRVHARSHNMALRTVAQAIVSVGLRL